MDRSILERRAAASGITRELIRTAFYKAIDKKRQNMFNEKKRLASRKILVSEDQITTFLTLPACEYKVLPDYFQDKTKEVAKIKKWMINRPFGYKFTYKGLCYPFTTRTFVKEKHDSGAMWYQINEWSNEHFDNQAIRESVTNADIADMIGMVHTPLVYQCINLYR